VQSKKVLMKIEIAKPTINPFGGLNFVVEEIKRTGIKELIDRELGERPPQSVYNYSDVFSGTLADIF
jgi:hypothetical protein